MAQLGTHEKPFVVKTGTIASKESRFRKKFNKEAYDFNYERIFKKEHKNELEACRAKIGKFAIYNGLLPIVQGNNQVVNIFNNTKGYYGIT